MRSTRVRYTLWAVTLLMASGLATNGCKKKGENSGKTEADKTAKADKGNKTDQAAARKSADPFANIKVDPALQKAVDAAVKACKVDNQLSNCKELKALVKVTATNGRQLDMLLGLLKLAATAKPEVATIAAASMYKYAYKGAKKGLELLAKQPDKLSKEAVAKVFANMKNLKTTRMAWAYGELAGIYGLTKEFIAGAAAMPKYASYVTSDGVTHFMVHARMKAFPAVQALSERKGELKGSYAWSQIALQAAHNLPQMKPAEAAKICPWAAKFLLAKDTGTGRVAGDLMVSCGQVTKDVKWMEKLLAAGRERITKMPDTWKNPVDFPFRDICFGGFFGRVKRVGQKDTKKDEVAPICAKTYDFLVWVTEQPKIADNMKTRAVSWISYQERNKKALKWLKKLARSKNKAVAAQAKKDIDYVKKHYMKKK